MKDKEKQIEEMAKAMQKCYEKNGLLNFKWLAESAYKTFSENSVVLTSEEYKIIDHNIKHLECVCNAHEKTIDILENANTEIQELNTKYYNEAKDLRRKLKKAQEFWKASVRTEQEAIKETAEKILKIIKEEYGYIGNLERIIAKQFGVEIKE